MFKPSKSQTQDLKSASDFEQWLSEINLFAQETQTELHEVAGLLNLALANDHPVELDVRNRLSSSSHWESTADSSGELAEHAEAEGDDYLASLQHKLAKQLKAKRNLTFPPQPEIQNREPKSTPTNTEGNSNQSYDPNITDPLL